MGSAIGHPSTALNPIGDPDTLSDVGSVDIGRLDVDLSFPVRPSSLSEGSSLTSTVGMSFSSLLLGNLFHDQIILIHVSLQYPDAYPLVFLPRLNSCPCLLRCN